MKLLELHGPLLFVAFAIFYAIRAESPIWNIIFAFCALYVFVGWCSDVRKARKEKV